jgi:putative NADH-flavin reductase
MTKIAIIGASKGCGLETLKDALARGWTVSAVARNPEQANLKDRGSPGTRAMHATSFSSSRP